jgi:fatty-acid peroxygenase
LPEDGTMPLPWLTRVAERLPDHSLALALDPYRYIARRCRQLGADAFETRLLGQRTICMSGPRAAQLFYDPQRFQRQGAAPEPLKSTLFGHGAVQGLDGPAHRRRKSLFMMLVGPAHVAELAALVEAGWARRVAGWGPAPVVLYREAQAVLTEAVCAWAGVPLADGERALRTGQLVSLFDDAGSWRHLRARWRRQRAQQWSAGLVRAVRSGRLAVPARPDGSPRALALVAHASDHDGRLLPEKIAAVELLNVLRPTVAVSVFIVQALHALHHHPQWRQPLLAGDAVASDCFMQEVRRFYPFFPAAVARARADFDWGGVRFGAGQRVMLDLYGTNHDPSSWAQPHLFRPQRFLERMPGLFDFIPQGGGEAALGHRCPGEGLALAVMTASVRALAALEWSLPRQDLHIDMHRLPALPRSGFVLCDVRQPRPWAETHPSEPHAAQDEAARLWPV